MVAALSDRRNERRGRRAGADDNDLLTCTVQIFWPRLRVNDPSFESLHAFPLGRVAFLVPVVSLAHPEKICGKANGRAVAPAGSLQCPEVVGARPVRARNPVPVANVSIEAVVVDDFAEISENLLSGRNRFADPWLEAIAEGVEVAVRSDAGIPVGDPGAAEALLGFEDHEAHPRALGLEVIGGADARDSGANDRHIEMLRPLRFGVGRRRGLRHRFVPAPVEGATAGYPPDVFRGIRDHVRPLMATQMCLARRLATSLAATAMRAC